MLNIRQRSPSLGNSNWAILSKPYLRQNWKRLMKWRQAPQHFLQAVCAAIAEIMFLRGAGMGACLLIAMFLQPSVLIMGLTGLMAAVTFATVAKLKQDYLNFAPLLFNPLLAGLSVGYLFQLSPASLFLSAAAGAFAFVLTWSLSHILRTVLLLPVLSLPFVAVSWIVHLAAFRYAGLQAAILPVHTYTIGLPLEFEGFLRTLGLIFFLPNIWVGIVVMLLLLINSRIQFFLAIAGYALGTYTRGILTGTFAYVYYDPATLNYILVALAIGGYYLLPSVRSYALAAIAVVMTAILGEAVSVFWAAVGLPVHAFPYNVVTLSLLYLLGSVGRGLLAKYPQASPEKTLDYELTERQRHQGSGHAIALPFAGRWMVWQGCDGRWTHQGLWRYAYDFVIRDEEGQTFRESGLQLSDYYAFQKPVLSPVSGWVSRVVRDLPDCAIGTVDQDRNWGNYVILVDDRGFYVEISHFAQDSIVVNQGDRIERGTLLGRCGNSGYSPQPHIHIQVQLTPEIGATTVPFSFANLRVNDEFCAESTPTESAEVEAVSLDRALLQALSLPLDSQIKFQVLRKGRSLTPLTVTVRMAIDGTFYLDSGKAKLYFRRDDSGFVFHRLVGNDPALAALLIAMPWLPLSRKQGQFWCDYVPIGLVTTQWRQMFYQFGSSLYAPLGSASYRGEWRSENTLVGTISIPFVKQKISTSVTFDRSGQLVAIDIDKQLSLQRIS
ncbi:urea transporter [Tumidithrix helvetica PCC 7403]|uniref:urea transporter n=1 Tax=Tumidithrix helvetica TaxID=3457545 RepID=UPI003C82A3C1